MKVTWDNSIENEIKHLYLIAKQIAKGNYQDKGILVFDQIQKDVDYPYAIFPCKKTLVTDDLSSLENFKDWLKDTKTVSKEIVEKSRKEWEKIEDKFINDLQQYFIKLPFNKIIITPTQYGLRGWHYTKNQTLHIFHRVDFNIKYIIVSITNEVIIENYLKPQMKENDDYFQERLWIEKQAISKFLMTHTTFAKYLREFESLRDQVIENEINLKIKKQSDENYATLGFPVTKPLKLNGRIIKLNNKKLQTLSETQYNLLFNFLKKQEQIITNEEIAEIMWGKDYYDQFSLSAMAKMIHQLRQRLKETGLQKEVIFTKRGKGYVLVQ